MVYISKKLLQCTREQKYVSKDICVKRVCVYLYTDIWEENTMLTPIISGICDYRCFFL